MPITVHVEVGPVTAIIHNADVDASQEVSETYLRIVGNEALRVHKALVDEGGLDQYELPEEVLQQMRALEGGDGEGDSESA